MIEQILLSLRRIRISPSDYEYDLHKIISQRFDEDGISYAREYVLGRYSRIDFFISGIGIEVKKGRPNRTNVVKQLSKYAEYDEIKYIIFVAERSVELPSIINGKQCTCITLSRNWGVAL